MPRLKQPIDELEEIQERSILIIERRLKMLTDGIVRGDAEKILKARRSLANVISASMAVSDLLGRRRAILEVDSALGRNVDLSARTPSIRIGGQTAPSERILRTDPRGQIPVVPQLPFKEAIESIVSREPRLSLDAVQTSRIYTFENGFAITADITKPILERVRKEILFAQSTGTTTPKAVDIIRKVAGLDRNHANTVFRTVTGTAYNDGRFEKAKDPAVRRVVGALMLVSTGDSDTRSNHRAADGTGRFGNLWVATVDDPIWQPGGRNGGLLPLLGYN